MLLICTWNYVFAPQNYGVMQTLPRKTMEHCRLCPTKSRSLHTMPCKIRESSYFASQNYAAMQTLPCKSHRQSCRGHNNNKKLLKTRYFFLLFSEYFCKSMIFQRSIKSLRQLFKKQTFSVTVPLRQSPGEPWWAVSIKYN